MSDTPNNREGPQAREPSKCLNRWRYGETLTKEAFSKYHNESATGIHVFPILVFDGILAP